MRSIVLTGYDRVQSILDPRTGYRQPISEFRLQVTVDRTVGSLEREPINAKSLLRYR